MARRESANKAVDKPTNAFVQRAGAWEKQKRLRAFAAQQRNDENSQPAAQQQQGSSGRVPSAGRQQRQPAARQQPRQALRF